MNKLIILNQHQIQPPNPYQIGVWGYHEHYGTTKIIYRNGDILFIQDLLGEKHSCRMKDWEPGALIFFSEN